MKLTILSDNRTSVPCIAAEHGLSILLETGKSKILLDTGASDLLIRNATILGVETKDIDYVFLSHGHTDHTGGLKAILDKAPEAMVIVSPYSIKRRFHSSRNGIHSISPDWPEEKMANRVIMAEHNMQVDGMQIITDIVREYPLPEADCCLYTDTADGLIPDDFKHEIALYVNGLLFTGCAHNGLLNILASCDMPVHTVIGGFHLLDGLPEDGGFETDEELVAIASELMKNHSKVIFYTGHCTGDRVYETMKSIMGDHLRQFTCGMSLEI